jgi:hypothetical protein
MNQKALKNALNYDPLTGSFWWLSGTHKGKRAGTLSSIGVHQVGAEQQDVPSTPASRLVHDRKAPDK